MDLKRESEGWREWKERGWWRMEGDEIESGRREYGRNGEEM